MPRGSAQSMLGKLHWLVVLAVAWLCVSSTANAQKRRQTIVVEFDTDGGRPPLVACIVTKGERGRAGQSAKDWLEGRWLKKPASPRDRTNCRCGDRDCKSKSVVDPRDPCAVTESALAGLATNAQGKIECDAGTADMCLPALDTVQNTDNLSCAVDERAGAADVASSVFVRMRADGEAALKIHEMTLDGGVLRLRVEGLEGQPIVLAEVVGGGAVGRGPAAGAPVAAGGEIRIERLRIPIAARCTRRRIDLPSSLQSQTFGWAVGSTVPLPVDCINGITNAGWCGADHDESSTVLVPDAERSTRVQVVTCSDGAAARFEGAYVPDEDAIMLRALDFTFTWERDACVTADDECPEVTLDDASISCVGERGKLQGGGESCRYRCKVAGGRGRLGTGARFPVRATFLAAEHALRWEESIQAPGQVLRGYASPEDTVVKVDLTPWIVKRRVYRRWLVHAEELRRVYNHCSELVVEQGLVERKDWCVADDAGELHECLDRCLDIVHAKLGTGGGSAPWSATDRANRVIEDADDFSARLLRDSAIGLADPLDPPNESPVRLRKLASLPKRQVWRKYDRRKRRWRDMSLRDRTVGVSERIEFVELSDASGQRHSLDPSASLRLERYVPLPKATCGQSVRVEVVGTRQHEPAKATLRSGTLELDPPERNVRVSRFDLALAMGAEWSPADPEAERVDTTLEGMILPALVFNTPASWLGVDAGLGVWVGTHPYFPASLAELGETASEARRVPYARIGPQLQSRFVIRNFSVAPGILLGIGVPLRRGDIDTLGVGFFGGGLLELAYRVGPRVSFIVSGRVLGGERFKSFTITSLFERPTVRKTNAATAALDFGVRFHLARTRR
jgi:hypothetical protein